MIIRELRLIELALAGCLTKRRDTVGELRRAVNFAPYTASLNSEGLVNPMQKHRPLRIEIGSPTVSEDLLTLSFKNPRFWDYSHRNAPCQKHGHRLGLRSGLRLPIQLREYFTHPISRSGRSEPMFCRKAHDPQHLQEHQEIAEKISAWLKAQQRGAAYLARRLGYTDTYFAGVLRHRHCFTEVCIQKIEQFTGLTLR
jgi:hypothetical protein